mgnify:CR=1 FL=1
MGIKQNFEAAKEEAKKEIKKLAKELAKKILTTVGPYLLGFILIAGCFFVIQGKLKDIADEVVKAASKVTSVFDNSSDTPAVIINDDLIKEVKKEMASESINIDETYLTDALLKASLEAYYATQYPYIDGVDYGDEKEGEVSNVIKGAIYLKRENKDMQYINYGSFTSMMGDGKSTSDKDDVKMKFSVDNDGNIVVATWSMTNTVTETKQEDGSYSQDGSETSTSYSISEYKIDQKTLTEQYTMSYKLPILLGNMYSNEGFGVAVAKLGRNAKIELSILDDTSQTKTVSRELLKENYKTSGTYSWRDMEDDPLKTDNFEGVEWANDYTSEDTAYKVITETSESNNITIKPTAVDTWTVKGEVTDIRPNTETTPNSYTNEMDNDSDYKEDTTTTVSQDEIDKIKENIMNNKAEGSEGPMTVNSIESVDAKVYKKVTDHKMKTDTTTTTTTYTSSDMQLTDNTDKFLALIKADSDGNYDKNGELVKYIKKGIKVTETTSAVSWTSNNNSSSTSGGDYIVKTDESGALPALTKKQLKKACNCLSGEEKKNALKFIDSVKDAEDKYKVNAVFSLAIFRKENHIASDKSGILGHDTYNIGSVKGSYNGQSYGEFKKYPNYDEAIVDYAKNIAEGKYYFKDGRYDVDKIGDRYCDPPDEWIKIVKGYIDEFYKSAGVSIQTDGGTGDVAKGGKGTIGTYKSTTGKKYNLYLQGGDAPWAGNKYGEDYPWTMGSSGCGPTAEAIIASAYNGNITPETTRADIVKYNGTGNHSSADVIAKSLKRLVPGIKTEVAGWSDTKIKNCLKNGGQVWLVVQNCKYTSGAHCMALIDYKENNKVYVAHGTAKTRPYGWDNLSNIHSYLKHPSLVYVGGK